MKKRTRQQQLRQEVLMTTTKEAIQRIQVFSRNPWWANLIGSLRPSLSTPQAQAAFRRFSDRSFVASAQSPYGMFFDSTYLDNSGGTFRTNSDSESASPNSRLLRYADYAQMDDWPELKSALDIYADEISQRNEDEEIITIRAGDAKLKREIENLLVKLDIENRIWHWARDMCKHGDKFVVMKIKQGEGVIDLIEEIHPANVDRIEADIEVEPFNQSVHNIPAAATAKVITFRWRGLRSINPGSLYQSNTPKHIMLTELDVLHLRIKGKHEFMPYGTSELDAARHHWRRLSHMEDAVFIYRVIRAPSRRIFNVEVGGTDRGTVETFMEEQKRKLRATPLINQDNGDVNRRMALMSMEKDYWIPMRNGRKMVEMDVAEGLQFQNDMEDIEYIQNHLFAATKVPKAFLNYDETVSAKSTLGTQDVRFGRTVQRIQDLVLEQVYKLVMCHLYFKRFPIGEATFSLTMTPSSLVTRMQNLEMLNERLAVASNAGELLPRKVILKKILGFTDEEIQEIMDIEAAGDMRAGSAVGGSDVGDALDGPPVPSDSPDAFGDDGGDIGGGAPTGGGAPSELEPEDEFSFDDETEDALDKLTDDDDKPE
tara:strand:+ start:1808 stop:3601 length:1794 start_codon:yes stop_codon:yes gene_type:complete